MEPKGRRRRCPQRTTPGGTAAGGGSPFPHLATFLLLLALLLPVAVVGVRPAAAASPIGTVDTFALPDGLTDARRLMLGPDGNVWFVSAASHAIGRITPDGAVTAFTHPDVREPVDIAAGPDGNLWFVARQGVSGARGTIGRITVSGSFTLHPSTEVFRPSSITVGPDGKLWFTDEGSASPDRGQVGTITTAGTIQTASSEDLFPSSVVFSSDGVPWLSGGGRIARTDLALAVIDDLGAMSDLRGSDLVPGPAGSMWFRGADAWSSGPDQVLRVHPFGDGDKIDRPVPGLGRAVDLSAAPDGGVWFSLASGSIGHVGPDGTPTWFTDASLDATGMRSGPDGSLWYQTSRSIGRRQANGTTWTIATPSVQDGLVIGADGNLWFVVDAQRIGRVTATPGDVAFSVAATAGVQQATVTWSPPPGTTPSNGYQVVASPGGAVCATSDATSCSVTGLTAGTTYTFTVHAVDDGELGPGSEPSNPVMPWSGAGYRSVPPTRILDSRLPNVGFSGAVTSTRPRSLQVTDLGGPANVPGSASAVVMNVTVTDSTKPSYLTVYPTGTSKPNASNLNFGTDQVIPNLVTVRIGVGGKVDIATAVGATHVVADVVGYYDDGTGVGSRFVPVDPVRLLDSRLPRPWGHPLDAEAPMALEVRSPSSTHNTIPWSATGVVVNVTVTNANVQSFLTVHGGGPRPAVSNLNFQPRQTIANLAVVSIDDGAEAIQFANAIGSVDVIVDLVGYLDPTAGSRFHPMDPRRVLDTRTGTGLAGKQGPGAGRMLPVAGAAGTTIPAGATGLVANLTVADATAESFVSVFPGVRPDPFSNVNFGIDQVIPNLAAVGLSPEGAVGLYNHLGQTHLIADAVGWYAPW